MSTTVNYQNMSIERDGVVYKNKKDWLKAYPDEDVGLLAVFSSASAKQVSTAPVPTVVTIRQATRVLLQVELLDDVEAIMASDAVDRATKIDWEKATEVNREWVEQSGLMEALGMDDDKLDQLFMLAATL